MACEYDRTRRSASPAVVDVNGILANNDPAVAGGNDSVPTVPPIVEPPVENEPADSEDANLIWADEDYTLILSEADGDFILLDNVFD